MDVPTCESGLGIFLWGDLFEGEEGVEAGGGEVFRAIAGHAFRG